MKVLVLNADYRPCDIWGWKKTMKKLLDQSGPSPITPVYDANGNIIKHDKTIRDGRGNLYDLPAVVVLTREVNVHNKLAPYTKTNIYARDMNRCQYCDAETTPENRTVDHVIPRAHWNPRRYHFKLGSFENVVTCCRACNLRKRNRTPQQAGMQLLRKPRNITRAQVYRNKRKLEKIYDQWRPFLSDEED